MKISDINDDSSVLRLTTFFESAYPIAVEGSKSTYATYLVSMQKYNHDNDTSNVEDTQFVKVAFKVSNGGAAHPQALGKQIDNHPKIIELRNNGYINQTVIASWKTDPAVELADIEQKLTADNLIQSYKWDYEKKAKELKAALDIMRHHEIHEEAEHNLAEKEGGMSDKERKSYNRKNGSNLKRAQPGGGPRRTSYCARSKGQMDKHNIDCRNDPDKPICKARRDWNC